MAIMKMGPIGDKSLFHAEWDETGRNVISHIIISYDKKGVRSIQFGFVENGALVMSKTYGSLHNGSCGNVHIVRLNHESEFVTGITRELYDGYITSLTFHTNQRKHEAVHLTFNSRNARSEKKEFVSGSLERGEFGGFFGSYDHYCPLDPNDYYLSSIGFYTRLVLPGLKAVKQEDK